MKRGITVFLADQLQVVRRGVAIALERQRGIRVVGEADNGRDAVNECRRLKPNVLIADLGLPKLNGLETAYHVQKCSSTKAMVVGDANDPHHAHHLERSVYLGIPGFIQKKALFEESGKAVLALGAGRNFYSPIISFEIAHHSKTPGWGKKDPLGELTDRERQVMQLITESYFRGQIAEQLGLSKRTIETHVRNIEEKIGKKGEAAIAIWGYRTGMSHGG